MDLFAEFFIQGSEPDPYHVVFTVDGRYATATCTCKGYQRGFICKHRIGLLHDYPVEEMNSEQANNVTVLRDAIAATDLGVALESYLQAREELSAAEKWFKKSKVELAEIMDG